MLRSFSFRRSFAIFSVLLACGSSAKAAIVYYAANATTPAATGFNEGGVWLDFFTGTVTTKTSGSGFLPGKEGQFQLMLNSGAGYLNFVYRTSSTTFGAWSNNMANGVDRLGTGESVDPTDVYNTFNIMASVDPYVNEWDGLGRGFIGVNFSNELGQIFYGYADVTVNADYTATLNGFAYENTPGAAIVTGAVPEPSGVAISIASLGFLLILRKRG